MKLVFLTLVIVLGLVFSHNPTPASAGIFGSNVQQVGLESGKESRLTGPTGGGDIGIVGNSALLPDAGPVGTAADITSPTSDQISIYVVRSGDSISDIAKMYNVTVNTILWANDLSSKSVLKEGQVLVILPVTGVRHLVAKGETVESLAKKYKADVKEIIQYNDLADHPLAIGDTVIIPDGEETPVVTPSTGNRTPTPTSKLKGASGPNYAGYYLRPIRGGVETQGLHGYNAVDLASSLNNPILAAADGTVILSRQGGWNGGYGNYVVIQHNNGTQTLYAHMNYQVVTIGQHVDQGQTIGYMGQTGKATGVHLHFEIRGAKNPF